MQREVAARRNADSHLVSLESCLETTLYEDIGDIVWDEPIVVCVDVQVGTGIAPCRTLRRCLGSKVLLHVGVWVPVSLYAAKPANGV